MVEIDVVAQALQEFSGMDSEAFALSIPFWEVRTYKKGEFYNEYKNVCKHLGFITEGVFRSYFVNEQSGEQRNISFFTPNQIIGACKSLMTQTPCNYYTECVVDSTIVYIHRTRLAELYRSDHQWEHFGRMIAEMALASLIEHTEGLFLKTPQQRYQELLKLHPDIFSTVPLYHIASYLGIQGPSLSRIRRRLAAR